MCYCVCTFRAAAKTSVSVYKHISSRGSRETRESISINTALSLALLCASIVDTHARARADKHIYRIAGERDEKTKRHETSSWVHRRLRALRISIVYVEES